MDNVDSVKQPGGVSEHSTVPAGAPTSESGRGDEHAGIWADVAEVDVSAAEGLPYPPVDFMHAIGSPSLEDFDAIGREFAGYFRDLAGMTPSSTILDIGCGCGRMARQLVPVLAGGTYDGFDVDRRLIDWCRENITERHPNFRFEWIDVSNNYYNPDGSTDASRVSFPYPDRAFSLVAACSIFTHLVPASASRYFEEISRVLAPGGKCLITVFLLNPRSRALLAFDKADIPFVAVDGTYASADPKASEGAIALDEEWLRAELARCGLAITGSHDGAWCGRWSYLTAHDLLVAEALPGR